MWQIDIRVGGRRYRPRFESKGKADEAETKLRNTRLDQRYGLRPAVPSPVTLSQLRDRWLDELRLRKRSRLREHERVLREFCNLVGKDLKLVNLKTPHLRAYLTKRLGDGLKPQSVNREATYVATMLHHAGELFASLETWICPKIPREKEPGHGRERVLTEDEINRILTELQKSPKRPNRFHEIARQQVYDVFVVALQTAMRGGELRNLKWTEVNFDFKTITVLETKTGKSRAIPMTTAVFGILSRRRRERASDPILSEYVFPNRRRGKHGRGGPQIDMRTVLGDASKRAGVPFGRDVPGGFSFHDLRHTATTSMLERGAPIGAVQLITGHSDRVMAMRYSHSTPASRESALRALEAFAHDGAITSTEVGESGKNGKSGTLE